MEIVIKGRRTEVSERFRRHVQDKLAKLERWDGKIVSIDVEVAKERNPRLTDVCERVEITCMTRGALIRAEAAAADPYAALDLAYAKLEVRMRKSADRRRVHHGSRTPISVAAATATLASANGSSNGYNPAAAAVVLEVDDDAMSWGDGGLEVDGDGPLVVREKTHQAAPMALDQALYEMELVGHDFFLFVDAETSLPSVVYRRHGYDYGVIRLQT
ncbi:ribosome-associated translation inhibitor RaiA [Sporichthya sp.]|uniref:ribosome hibernation-promoting factor, HPF/YfiA family n=1 Tax=Sporichthya sp. TaxID=65475 RepID=UPI00180638D5|nr:ribosome-associated translation inhibitor RaiA [Sporichthya sp.]MBA3744343.1 ribosome-associated translation inhibitor RaiA [Sporichthya sp.]